MGYAGMTLGTRQRKCIIKSCRQPFKPISMAHKCCSAPCAAEYAKEVRVKKEAQEARLKTRREAEEKREHRKKVEKLKTRQQWLKEAQIEFNRYIRHRDMDKPCICCSKPLGDGEVGGSFDCGHYRSVGSAPHLRFDERNAHAQRKHCNRYGSGRAVDYRVGLIARIGIDAVEALESDQSTKKYSIDDLKAIKTHYRNKVRELKKERE